MVLVAALLIMAVMTIVGAASITTSRLDIQISGNTKISRQVFFWLMEAWRCLPN
jgi:type II secretory pathway component PulK